MKDFDVLGVSINRDEDPPEQPDDPFVVLRINLPIPRDTFDAMSEKRRAEFLELAEQAAGQMLDPAGPTLWQWRLEHLERRDAEERLSGALDALDALRRAFLKLPTKARPPELRQAMRLAYQRVKEHNKHR